MSSAPRYTEHHPRWYRQRVSTYWWLWRWPYLKFVLREMSSIFVAWFVVVTLLQFRALSAGQQAHGQFLEWLRSPGVLLLNLIGFFFILFHTFTWFNLAPAAVAVRLVGKRVPASLIVAGHYAAWLVASAAIVWLVLRG